jgi:hypothetical protein
MGRRFPVLFAAWLLEVVWVIFSAHHENLLGAVHEDLGDVGPERCRASFVLTYQPAVECCAVATATTAWSKPRSAGSSLAITR